MHVAAGEAGLPERHLFGQMDVSAHLTAMVLGGLWGEHANDLPPNSE